MDIPTRFYSVEDALKYDLDYAIKFNNLLGDDAKEWQIVQGQVMLREALRNMEGFKNAVEMKNKYEKNYGKKSKIKKE